MVRAREWRGGVHLLLGLEAELLAQCVGSQPVGVSPQELRGVATAGVQH